MASHLKVGDSGEDIARLHDRLVSHGIEVSAEDRKQRFFGPSTRAAVRDFQHAHGIDPSCEVCMATAARLEAQPVATAAASSPFTHRPTARLDAAGEMEARRSALINPGEREVPITDVHLPERESLLVPIIAPLQSGDTGPRVANLQDALFVLLERKIIRPLDAPNLPTQEELNELSKGLTRERKQSLFGEAAKQLVIYFQVQQGIGDNLNGVVEDKTAAKLNELLKSIGALDDEAALVVHGTVQTAGGKPLSGAVVRAFHETKRAAILLGEDTTDTKGHYTIRYDIPPEVTSIRLRVSVIGEDGTQLQSSQVIYDAKPLEIVDLKLAFVEQPAARVYGIVRNEYGEPLDDAIVRAFDRDMRSEQLLGSALTKEGHYEIRYNRSQFLKAEKEQADLVVKVLDAAGAELYKTPIQYNVPDEIEVNIVLQGAEYKGPSEWDVLTNTLMPLLEDVSPLELREDDQYQDISFLAGESGAANSS